jgi:hypothetical protein
MVTESSNSASDSAQQTLLSVPQQVTAVKQVLTSMDALNTGARENRRRHRTDQNRCRQSARHGAQVEGNDLATGTMMIEDDELRALFQTECEEHLQSLDEGLLRLENEAGESATLEAVFRAAHS